MSSLAQATVNGLLAGGFYALLALGLTFAFGVMRIINFAHGELVMLGSYTTFVLFTRFGVDPFISLMLVIPLLGIVGALLQRYMIEPVLEAPHLNQILLTVGISTVMANSALMGFGGNFYSVSTAYSDAVVRLGSVSFGLIRFIACLVGLLLTVGLHVILQRTDLGRRLRAVSQSLRAARVVGIDVRRTFVTAFVISAILGGVAGVLSVMIMYVHPSIGFSFIIKVFAIVVLGGLGSVPGALIGALSMGLLESYVATYVSNGSGWAEALAFLVLMLFLVVRPKGLFGTE